MDLNRATQLTKEAHEQVDDMFEYHKWDDAKVEAGREVRSILAHECRNCGTIPT